MGGLCDVDAPLGSHKVLSLLHTSLALKKVSHDDTCANERNMTKMAGTTIVAGEAHSILLKVGDEWYETAHVTAHDPGRWRRDLRCHAQLRDHGIGSESTLGAAQGTP